MNNLHPVTSAVNTPEASTAPTRPSIWESWGDTPRDWQDALIAATQDAIRPEFRTMYQVIQAWGKGHMSYSIYLEYEALIADTCTQILELGILMGFGMAKTMPRGIEELESWPQRARIYAGIERATNA